jgi:parallel beta-helix repeat protein
MNTRKLQLSFALVLALASLVGTLALLGTWGDGPPVAHAQGTERYVAATGNDSGNDCTASGTPCATIQHAVDESADEDVILVATGAYTGVHARSGVTQVVYISQSLTVRGGYTTSDWNTSDPTANPTTIDAEGAGRVLYIAGPATVTLEGLNVTGGAPGDWHDGGGICALDVTITISRCQIYSNTTGYLGYAGGMLIRDSVVRLTDSAVYGNEAFDTAGLLIRDSRSVLSGNTIRDNATSFPGAHTGGLCIDGGQATLTANTVQRNQAPDGGMGGVRLYGNGTFTLNDNAILSNTAEHGAGGIFVAGTSTLISNTIRGNTAQGIEQDTGNGGGLYLGSGEHTVLSNTISYNYAEMNGGGVYANPPDGSDTRITMAGNTIHNNEANADGDTSYGGGGLYLDECTAALNGNTIRDNWVSGLTSDVGGGLSVRDSRVTLAANRVISNASDGSAGGLYLYSNDAITLTGNTVASNTAVDDGGGVILYFNSWGNEIITLTNNTVTSNTSGGDGGGLWLKYNYTVTLTSNTIRSNVASGEGGGVYLEFNYDPATLVSNTVDSNTAHGSDGGGGLYLDDAATLAGNTVSDNATSSGHGGGLYMHDDDIVLEDNTVSHNRAGVGNGGGLYMAHSNATLRHNEIISNTARGSGDNDEGGGGLYLYLSDAALSNNTVTSNTAANNGGGLFLSSSNPVLDGNRIAGNTAGGSDTLDGGGGLYLRRSNPVLVGNAVVSNTAAADGGGFYIYSSNAALQSNWIAGNAATDGGGAALYDSASTVLGGNTLFSNAASANGGGVHLYRSDTTLRNNVVAENQAGTAGSGIYVYSGAPELIYTTVADNGDGDGSGLYVSGSAPTLVNTILVSQTVGVVATAGNAATLDGVLWSGNGANTGGAGTIIATNDVTGTPDFVAPAHGDYHILATSTAVDNGVAHDYALDIDGDYRPLAAPPDLGADEVVADPPACQARLNGGTIYATVQEAIDASVAPTDLVEVSGFCTDTIPWNGSTYVAVVTQTLTLKGGYSTDFATWDPDAYPTLFSGLWQGGVVAIEGTVSPTVEYVTLLAGQGTEGGGVWSNGAAPTLRYLEVSGNIGGLGGGVMLRGGAGRLEQSRVTDNRAVDGGGVCLIQSSATVFSNTIQGNTATGGFGGGGGLYLGESNASVMSNTISENAVLASLGGGGGLYLDASHGATLSGNDIRDNSAMDNGGGVSVDTSHNVTLVGNTIQRNAVDEGSGGGLDLYSSDQITLSHNAFLSNTAWWDGGGVHLSYSNDGLVEDNVIRGNAAGMEGGGIQIYDSDNATAINNVVMGNQAGPSHYGSGICVEGSTPVYLLHTTIHDNTGGDGSGVYVTDAFGDYSDVWLTNTIVASQTVGVGLDFANAAYVNGVLWFGNGTDTVGSVAVENDHDGPPAFAADGYHLTGGSDAIDRGVGMAVASDIDGQRRTFCAGPDLGADEYPWGVAPTGVSIDGPTTGVTDTTYAFTATVGPITATTPVTYTWAATDHSLQIHTGIGLSDTVAFDWGLVGVKTVTVTVVNPCGSRSGVLDVDIRGDDEYIYLPLVLRNQ